MAKKMNKFGLKVTELRSIYDQISLKGKCAFVTGAAGGIGRSSAATMAELGADVAINDLESRRAELEEIASYLSDKFGVKVIVAPGDLSKEESVKEIVAFVAKELGTIDVVHSNAGITNTNEDGYRMSQEFWRKITDINLTANLLVAQETGKIMERDGHGGSIIMTASMSAHIVNRRPKGVSTVVAYCALKAGVKQLAKALAMDMRDLDIRVNSISPGYVLSGLHKDWTDEMLEFCASNIPMDRMADLNEVMGPVAFLASDMSSYCTGMDMLVDGGFTVW